VIEAGSDYSFQVSLLAFWVLALVWATATVAGKRSDRNG
jgi:hypothetical protein